MKPKHIYIYIYKTVFMYSNGAFVGVMNEKFNFYLKYCGEEAI